jgi:hypothetical protein
MRLEEKVDYAPVELTTSAAAWLCIRIVVDDQTFAFTSNVAFMLENKLILNVSLLGECLDLFRRQRSDVDGC